jgi:hypothetical protein
MRDSINIAQSDQLVSQQPQRPMLPTGGWGGASQRQQVSLNLSVQLALSPTAEVTPVQGRIQSFFHAALADTMNGLAANIEGLFDSLISPSWTLGMGAAISFEQDLSMGTHLPRGSAGVDQLGEVSALIGSQSYDILSVSRHWVGYLQSADLKQSLAGFYPIHACISFLD